MLLHVNKFSYKYEVLLEDHELAEAGKFPKFMKLLKHLNGCISVRGTSNHLEKLHVEVRSLHRDIPSRAMY